MDNELPYKILEVLRKVYDEKPTGVLATPEIADILKISIKDAQAGLIYLKEKEMINSYQNFDNRWVQKINANGIDELNDSVSKSNIDNTEQITSSLKIEPKNLIEKFNQCISELDELGKPLDDIGKLIMPNYTINVDYGKLNEIYGRTKNLLKYAFVDGTEKSKQFVREYDDHCAQKRYIRNSFQPYKEEETDFKYRKLWLRRKAVDLVNELKIIHELQPHLLKTETKTDSTQTMTSTSEKPLEFDVSHEDHTGKIKVFISHKFIESDQKLASNLQSSLREHDIYGYLAERKKEYDLVFGEKIKNEIKSSDYLIAIITKNSRFAPSVHQEIGYALGVNVPVRIMAEEQEAKGVLVEGRDIEKFSRKNFEKPLDNIIKDIIKKGHKKKDSHKNPELIREVYRPLYNVLSNLNDKAFLQEKLEDPWNIIDNYSKLKTDTEIRERFEILSAEIQQWNSMSREKEREFQLKQVKIGDIFKPCFEKAGLLKNDEDIILSETSSQKPRAWVSAFKDILLYTTNIRDSEDLYQKLFAHAMLRDDEHSLFLKGFRRKAPKLFEYLYDKIPEARKVFESEIEDGELYAQKITITSLADGLSEELEEKF